MSFRSRVPATFFTLGIAFVAIGLSGQDAFLYIGLAFLIAAVVAIWRRHEGSKRGDP